MLSIFKKALASVTVCASLMLGFTQSAYAALTAAQLTPVVTEITDDVNLVFTTILPVIGTVLAIGVGIRLFKRMTNKV